MRIQTLARYLIGSRKAILEIASCRKALWIGLIFVLSAGFAREYDGEDLLREPWYLLIPIAASLAASSLLFLVACGTAFLWREGRPPFWQTYRSFLTLFWMTAPLAWFYAIPYERFLSPGTATQVNLWTLALVAAWRVLLMIRVVSVITGRGVISSTFLVMLFADVVALTTVYLMPKPVISFMGGVRLSESEAAVNSATMLVFFLGLLTFPIWFLGACWAVSRKPNWQIPPAASPQPTRSVWVLASISLIIWLPILPFTQAEQWLRSRVEQKMKSGQISEAIELMSAHPRSDFPPGWEPPPRIGYLDEQPHILDVMEVLVAHEVSGWVHEEFVAKFRRYLGHDYHFYYYAHMNGPDAWRIVRILEQLPEGPKIAAAYNSSLNLEGDLKDPRTTEEKRSLIVALLKLAEQYHQTKKQ